MQKIIIYTAQNNIATKSQNHSLIMPGLPYFKLAIRDRSRANSGAFQAAVHHGSCPTALPVGARARLVHPYAVAMTLAMLWWRSLRTQWVTSS
jgi:hypothetical protein